MSEPRRFDVGGPLPTGVIVLEASGTGKTYTIAALAARYVASGIPLHKILLVTFTRLATGELRERVRERLLQTEEGLRRVLDGQPAGDDEVLQLLAAGPADEVRIRRDRLSRALADFDAATIATTHGFCLEALSGLGIVADVEHGCEVTEDAFDLLEDVIDDLYVRRFGPKDKPAFTRREAHEIARAAARQPQGHHSAAGDHRRRPACDAGATGRCRARGARTTQAAVRGPDLRRPPHTPRLHARRSRDRRVRCRQTAPSATRSPWSTSSRTPTRSSGTSSAARSPRTSRTTGRRSAPSC